MYICMYYKLKYLFFSIQKEGNAFRAEFCDGFHPRKRHGDHRGGIHGCCQLVRARSGRSFLRVMLANSIQVEVVLMPERVRG